MKSQEFIKAFEAMSPEDQAEIRTHLFPEAAQGSECCSGPMKEHLADMMKEMKASDDPMAMCHQMMQMCQKMMACKCSA